MSRTSARATITRSYICELCGEQISHDAVRVDGRDWDAGMPHVRHRPVNPCRRLCRDLEYEFTPFSHSVNRCLTEIHSHVANITSFERS